MSKSSASSSYKRKVAPGPLEQAVAACRSKFWSPLPLNSLICDDAQHDLTRSNIVFKAAFTDNAYFLIISDLKRVWTHASIGDELELEHKTYAPSLQADSRAAILDALRQLLMESSSNQAHTATADEDVFKLNSSMNISLYTLRWEFECQKMGNHHEQTAFLADDLYLPLIQMNAILAFRAPRPIRTITSEEETAFKRFCQHDLSGALEPLYINIRQLSPASVTKSVNRRHDSIFMGVQESTITDTPPEATPPDSTIGSTAVAAPYVETPEELRIRQEIEQKVQRAKEKKAVQKKRKFV